MRRRPAPEPAAPRPAPPTPDLSDIDAMLNDAREAWLTGWWHDMKVPRQRAMSEIDDLLDERLELTHREETP